MQPYEQLICELLDETSPRRKHERILELLDAEREVSTLRARLAAWEIFRDGISEQYPQLLVWCPEPLQRTYTTIHDQEFPDVIIVDQVTK